MSDACDYKRCRQQSVVGVRPTRGTERFLCWAHWVQLTERPGSVCAGVREFVDGGNQ